MDRDIRQQIIWVPNLQGGLQDDLWTSITPDLLRSKGVYLHDLRCRKPILDLNGFFGSAAIRYDHPALSRRAFGRKLFDAARYRPSLSDFWTKELAEFVDTFRRVAMPAYPHHFEHFFFVEGGALAVENALKAAFDWKVRMNMQAKIYRTPEGDVYDPQEELQPIGSKVIGFNHAFHGRAGYTLSITHTKPEKYKYFPKFPWFRHIDPPIQTFDANGNVIDPEGILHKSQQAIAEVRRIFESNPNDIAAILIEPIQCEGGDRHILPSFLVELRKLANEFDAILIYDEVQTGLGVTGKMWAHEHFGSDAKPDVIAFAKKAQVGGIIADSKRFGLVPDNVFANHEGSYSRINSTWGGNPADMVRATVILNVIEEEKLLNNAASMGKYFLEGLHALCREFPKSLLNPRGRGLLLAIDVVRKIDSPHIKLWDLMKKQHLLALVCGEQTLRFRPQLDITRNDIDEAFKRMRRALYTFERKYQG